MEKLCDEACKDPEILETLFAVARPRLIRLVQVRMAEPLERRLDPDDVVQEALVAAAERFEQFKRSRKVPVFVWLRGLALERLIEANRRHWGAEKRSLNREVANRSWFEQSSLDLLQRWAVDSHSPSRLVADRQRRDDLNEALNQLPENYREVLVLRFFESLTIAETAASMGCSVSNAKVLQYRALKRLENFVTDSLGWSASDQAP